MRYCGFPLLTTQYMMQISSLNKRSQRWMSIDEQAHEMGIFKWGQEGVPTCHGHLSSDKFFIAYLKQWIANNNMAHISFLERQNLCTNLQKGFSFWETSRLPTGESGFAPGAHWDFCPIGLTPRCIHGKNATVWQCLDTWMIPPHVAWILSLLPPHYSRSWGEFMQHWNGVIMCNKMMGTMHKTNL